MHGKIAHHQIFQKQYEFFFWWLVSSKIFGHFRYVLLEKQAILKKNEKSFSFFLRTWFRRSSANATLPQYNMKPNIFFVWKLFSGASQPRGLFFKISLLLLYKSTSLRKKHHFLEVFRVIKFFIRFFSLKRVNLKKRATRSAGPRNKLSNKKKNCIYNEGPWRFFGAKMTYFWPLFCSYLRQMLGYGAENFITASSLQPQHMLQISAHLYVPGLRSIFEGGRP